MRRAKVRATPARPSQSIETTGWLGTGAPIIRLERKARITDTSVAAIFRASLNGNAIRPSASARLRLRDAANRATTVEAGGRFETKKLDLKLKSEDLE
jgi:hypothetical protein